MRSVLITLVVLSLGAMPVAQKLCSTKDPGPFLATPPQLTMEVSEATELDLNNSREQYRAELRLYGQVGVQGVNGIDVAVLPNYQFFNPEDVFTFTYDSQNNINVVQLFKPLDRDGPTADVEDDTDVFSFTLSCTVLSNASDVTYYDARIFVTDVNDNSPDISSLASPLVVNELTPPGTEVLEVRAIDKDINSNLTYRVIPSSEQVRDLSGAFEIDPVSGKLRVKSELDFETRANGTLVISVTDSGVPPRTSISTLQVIVEDGDDQGPAFTYPGCFQHRNRCSWPKYTTSNVVKKGQPISVLPVPNVNNKAVSIMAHDLDGLASPVMFSIAATIPAGSEGKFTVTSSSSETPHFMATITPTEDMTVPHGFEIFLQAEEQTQQKRFEIAMILFQDPSRNCSTSSGQTGNPPMTESEMYTQPIVALIVVSAILSTLVLCLTVAVFFIARKSGKSADVALTRM